MKPGSRSCVGGPIPPTRHQVTTSARAAREGAVPHTDVPLDMPRDAAAHTDLAPAGMRPRHVSNPTATPNQTNGNQR